MTKQALAVNYESSVILSPLEILVIRWTCYRTQALKEILLNFVTNTKKNKHILTQQLDRLT